MKGNAMSVRIIDSILLIYYQITNFMLPRILKTRATLGFRSTQVYYCNFENQLPGVLEIIVIIILCKNVSETTVAFYLLTSSYNE